MDTTELKRIIEAALLASTHPLSMPQLEALFAPTDAVAREDMTSALDALREDCAGRGVELVEVASGFRLQVRREVQPWVAKLWTERPARYSRALLETLALIAYRQPITRGEIEQVRGVSVSTHITRTLEEREWIRVVGHRETPGRPELFGTTRTFLDYFNLKSLDELPPLAEILNLEEMNPQLDLADPAAQVGPPEAAAADDGDTGDAAADPDATATDTDADADDDTSPPKAAPLASATEAAEAPATPEEKRA